MYLRYGWDLKNVPATCICKVQNTISHALKIVILLALLQSELRDVTANSLKTICNYVAVEPDLEPLTGNTLPSGTIRINETRTGISMRDLWQRQHKAFLDVRVFNPLARSYQNLSLSKIKMI